MPHSSFLDVSFSEGQKKLNKHNFLLSKFEIFWEVTWGRSLSDNLDLLCKCFLFVKTVKAMNNIVLKFAQPDQVASETRMSLCQI